MLDLGRTFLQSAERNPGRIAIVDDTLRLSYGQWLEEIQAVAHGLRNLGIGRGDHVAVLLQNNLEMATLHWACQFLGAIVTPLNWRSKAEEIDYCLQDAGARAVVFGLAAAEALADAPAAPGLPRIFAGDDIDSCPQMPGPAPLSFTQLAADRPTSLIMQAGPEDISLMLYTSGTTGKPKGVPRRHRHERAAALAHVAQNLYRNGERTLGVMPLYHTMGVRSLLSMAMVDGRFVCVPRFDPDKALDLIARESISCLYLVPTLYHDLLVSLARRGGDTQSVSKLGFAGSPMNDGLLHRLQETFQPELFVNHYGCSEIYTISIEQDATRKPGSSGRAGLNTRLRLVSLDARSPEDLARPGEEGEIIADLAGDEAFEAYWNRPDADRKAIRDGWYFTGDTGFLDADGDLFVTGRVDDMIISGGENISPVEIESVLSLHDSVDEVAVVGLPDKRWGQKVVAFIKPQGEAHAGTLDSHCRQSGMLNFKRPRDYIFVNEIPKSAVGKILRRKLVAGEYEALDETAGREA